MMEKHSDGAAQPAVEREPIAVVGIGASAGGLEALTQLLRKLPPATGLAYAIVQHLDPHHESILATLLSKATQMQVKEGCDGMAVNANCVYVIPPNTEMTIVDGTLSIEPRDSDGKIHLPIDAFLRSLAEVHGNRAIGVVLSGNATDGTLGLKAIKAEGGITFAQDPATAKFDGMPRSAIAAQCVDYVLPAEKIAVELARLGSHPYMKSTDVVVSSHPLTGRDNAINRIFALLKKRSGVDFSYYKQSTIKRRIARRMALTKVDSLKEYAEQLSEDPAELENLYQDLLIKVTRFFRDPETFEFLKAKIFPPMIAHSDRTVRMWVPGCSTGEEVYSLAISVLEFLNGTERKPSVQIFATDVSDTAIAVGREGSYLANIADDISPERLRRYFTKLDGRYQVSKSIREMCIFARQDITSDPPFSRLDLISCRNVMIYLESTLQRKVIPLFHYALKPTGHLVLGGSETIGLSSQFFSVVDKRYRVYAKVPAQLEKIKIASGRTIEAPETPRRPLEKNQDESFGSAEAKREADRALFARFNAAGAVVNDRFEIVQFRGDTSPFLENAPGEPSLNVLKMARENMALQIRTLVADARSKGTVVRREEVELAIHRRRKRINIEVHPLRVGGKFSYFLILFEMLAEPKAASRRQPKGKSRKPDADWQRENHRLRNELSSAKSHIQTVIEEQEAGNEELQSANEEILSSNEELQSINEELETAKEELQSTNEELTTVNDELSNTNNELGQLNSVLTTLLTSLNIAIVMVGTDLRIRRFTPMAEKLFSLIPTDIGRPIGDVKAKLDLPDLAPLIRETIEAITPKEIDVTDADGRCYSMRIRPHRTQENKIDGAILLLIDVDALMKRKP